MSSRLTRSASKASLVESSTSQVSRSETPVVHRKRPAKRASAGNVALDSTTMQPPSTPPAKRARKLKTAETPLPPITPTPAVARLISGVSTPDPGRTSVSGIIEHRPADPLATNALLATPHGTRYTAYPQRMSPSPFLSAPDITTGNLLETAVAHLIKVEPRLVPIVAAHSCPVFTSAALSEPVNPFKSLVSGIIAQQVSGAAAASIKRKFVGLFVPSEEATEATSAFPTPEQVAKADLVFLRTAGLSGRKAEYVKGLAEKFVAGELSAQWLTNASWEEMQERLIAVRGLGMWSIEMFACFALKRMDVFSTGDLGVQRGMAALLGKDVKKLKAKGGGKWKYLSEKEMLEHSAKFAPYRSLFMWYCWRVEDVNVDAIQNA